MIRRFFLTFLLTLGVSARAQLGTPGLSSSITNMLNQLGTPAPASTAGQPAQTQPAAGKPMQSMNFKPDAALRQQAIRRFVDGFRESAPALAAELEKNVKTIDVFGEIDKQLKTQYSLSVNNLADAMTLNLLSVYQVSLGQTDDPPKAQVLAVNKQLKTLLGSGAALTDAQKQQAADGFTLQALLISMFSEAYKDKPDQLMEFGRALNEGLKGMGLDLSLLELTDQGFVKKP